MKKMIRLIHVRFFIVLSIFIVGCQPKTRFRVVHPKSSNIDFVNEIVDNDSFNILTFEYIYNGGGVAIADFDDDGRSDIFFTGNMVPNRLYLNKGDLEFEDVSDIAGVGVAEKWCSGVAVIDINLDGKKDLYLAATTHQEDDRRQNILLINKGLNDDGVPQFHDEAAAYGIDDDSHTVNSAFLDYDQDGDLDLYLVINKMEDSKTPNIYKDRQHPVAERVDKLYENQWSDQLGHPVFTDVSEKAGIVYEGYGLGVNATDINLDGYTDILVTNDYLSRDIVYVNNGDGTFSNKSDAYFRHTSYSAMGNDVVDVNNDGLPDVVALDMLPEDNYRRKTMLMNNSYMNYINNEKYDYQYQFTRNTFQVNQGFDPTTGDPVFSDQALMAGVSCTDWSWAPLVADFDNDGLRDLIITNGFPKDVTDRDFIDYNSEFSRLARKSTLLSKIPSVKLKNYAYRNVDGLHFQNVTDAWGIAYPSFSNGAAYGDLDNDGDLDYVVNNINDPAFLVENLSNDRDDAMHWLRIRLHGSKNNPAALGTKISLYAGGEKKYWEHSVYRGYLSSVEEVVHFGLGQNEVVDSIAIDWYNGLRQVIYQVEAQQVLKLNRSEASADAMPAKTMVKPVFTDVSNLVSKHYQHQETDIIDFNIQPLLPHKLSQYGPSIAVTDVNADGLDDLYLGGARNQKGTFLIQQADGSFLPENRFASEDELVEPEEMGCLFFDADNDGDQDLYVVSGSNEASVGEPVYQDRFFENRLGRFYLLEQAIPPVATSGSCVRAADFDRDGDLDLFVGGRLVPFEYPKPATSHLLENTSENQEISFNVVDNKAPFLHEMGLVSDALWSDFDGDGWVDLVVAGEWMPIRFFKNNQGHLVEVTGASGVQDKVGWWNSLVAGDFDQDGDIDYVAGNLGTNTLFKATDEHPLGVYGADFDGNGGFDLVPTVFLKNALGQVEEVPYFGRGDMIKQINAIRASFKKYADFGRAGVQEMFTSEQLSGAISYKANYLYSSYIENKGNGGFEMSPLPVACQVAPVYGMVAEDLDGNGGLELLMVGNDFGMEVLQGRMDAMKGLVLEYHDDGFVVRDLTESGFYVPGDAKGLAALRNEDGGLLVVATQNRDSLRAFATERAAEVKTVELAPQDFRLDLQLKNGAQRVREYYYGHSFLSQSSRRVAIPNNVQTVTITRYNGDKRQVPVNDF